MLAYLLETSDLSTLFRFVSRDFFKVVPMGDLLAVAKTLRRNANDRASFSAACASLDARLVASSMAVRVASPHERAEPSSEAAAQATAPVLELFFFQVLAGGTWLLDFRTDTFRAIDAHTLGWSPKPLWWSPSPGFCEGTRELYGGFYGGDPARFDRALARLGLTAARRPLQDHFGLGDQRAVRFELEAFQKTFAAVFEACRRAGATIPPEFAVLGTMLLTLYENLERSGRIFDVRAAFERAEVAATRATSGGAA